MAVGLAIAGVIAVDILAPGVGIALSAWELSALASIAGGLVLGGIGSILSKQQTGMGQSVRNPIAPWNVVYGRAKIGGVTVFLFTGGQTNKYLQAVYLLACHPIQSIDALLFDGQRVMLDTNGNSLSFDDSTAVIASQQTVDISTITRQNDVVTVVLVNPMPLVAPTAAGPAMIDGDRFQIQNVNVDETLNGVFPISVVNPSTFTYICGGLPVTSSNQGSVVTCFNDWGDTVHVEQNITGTGPAFPGLLSSDDSGSNGLWTSTALLSGRASVYLRLKYGGNTYASGLPTIGWVVHGKCDILDPRTNTNSYSENPCLICADYLHHPIFGFGANYGTDIPLPALSAAANVCDELVPLASGGTEPRYTCNGSFQLSAKRSEILSNLLTSMAGKVSYCGGVFTLFPAIWYPPTLAINANLLMVSANCPPWWSVSGGTNSAFYIPGQDAAHALPPCVWGTPISAGQSVTVQYVNGTCSIGPGDGYGYFNAAGEPGGYGSSVSELMGWTTLGNAGLCGAFTDSSGNVIQALDIGLGGTFTCPAGATQIQFGVNDGTEWLDNAGSFTLNVSIAGAPLGIGMNQMSGPFKWLPKVSVRDLYNGCKGTYTSPINFYQSSDFPAYAQDADHGYTGSYPESDLNMYEDGGQRRWLDIEQPFCISSSQAQRCAKINLMRARQQGTGTFAFNLAAYQATALDVIEFTLPILGWSSKLLEVTSHRFTSATKDGATVLGTELTLQETDPSVYAWTIAEELNSEGFVQNTTTPGVGIGTGGTVIIPAPTNIVAVSNSSTTVTNDAGITSPQIEVTWTLALGNLSTYGGFLTLQYRLVGSGIWQSLPRIDPTATTAYIGNGLMNGQQYNIQMQANSGIGQTSAWAVPAAGAVTVASTATAIAVSHIASGGATASEVLTYNGTAWVPAVLPLPVDVQETPSGTINGSNLTFGLSYVPLAESLSLVLNGIEQDLGVDYTLTGATITYANPLVSGDTHEGSYQH